MRILSVGDLHYNIPQFDWLASHAGNFDVVIIVGDLLNIGCDVDLDTQIHVVSKYLNVIKQKTQLIVCSGNHDGERQNSEGEFFADWLEDESLRGISGDGASLDIEGWHFSVCPWWDGPIGKENLKAFLESESCKNPDNWFIVHHAPPSDTKTSWSRKRDFGDAFLREFIESHSPSVVLSGHVHQAPFREGGSWYDRIGETWIFNAGYLLGELPPYLEFKLLEGEVRWISIEGIESVSIQQAVS